MHLAASLYVRTHPAIRVFLEKGERVLMEPDISDQGNNKDHCSVASRGNASAPASDTSSAAGARDGDGVDIPAGETGWPELKEGVFYFSDLQLLRCGSMLR